MKAFTVLESDLIEFRIAKKKNLNDTLKIPCLTKTISIFHVL